MKINGDLQVLGRLLGLKLEVLAADPTGLSSARLWALSNEEDSSVELRFYNGVETISLGAGAQALTAFTQNVDAAGFLLKNLPAPVDGNDAARKVDIENALAGLDYQKDVLSVLNAGDTPVAGRYILGTFDTEGVGSVNDIVEYSGDAFTVAYDVSEAGPGALVYNRGAGDNGLWYRWDGVTWEEFQGLSEITAGLGLEKDGNQISVKVKENGRVLRDADGLSVDVSGLATTAEVEAIGNSAGDATTAAQAATAAAEAATTAAGQATTAVSNLSTELDAVKEDVQRLTQSYFDFEPAAAGTVHTVTHNLLNKYPLVQVVDPTDDEVIGVQSIKFVDENTLTVTLAEAASVRVVVQGYKGVEAPTEG